MLKLINARLIFRRFALRGDHSRLALLGNQAHKRIVGVPPRCLCTDTSSSGPSEGERLLTKILKEKFPTATFVKVEDISGGCGSMYEIQLEAEEFRGKRTVMQHRLVNEALREQIKDMHGLRISTAVPEKS